MRRIVQQLFWRRCYSWICSCGCSRKTPTGSGQLKVCQPEAQQEPIYIVLNTWKYFLKLLPICGITGRKNSLKPGTDVSIGYREGTAPQALPPSCNGLPMLLKQLQPCVSHSESFPANPGPPALIPLHFMPKPRALASSREHWQGSSEQGISALGS